MTPPERVGTGRRDVDGHCDIHIHNTETLDRATTDLSGLKSAFKVLVWVVSISVPVVCGVVGYFVMQMDHTMDKLADNLVVINNTVQSGQISAAENYAEIRALKVDVQEMRVRR